MMHWWCLLPAATDATTNPSQVTEACRCTQIMHRQTGLFVAELYARRGRRWLRKVVLDEEEAEEEDEDNDEDEDTDAADKGVAF